MIFCWFKPHLTPPRRDSVRSNFTISWSVSLGLVSAAYPTEICTAVAKYQTEKRALRFK
jgi:hypothetical protein